MVIPSSEPLNDRQDCLLSNRPLSALALACQSIHHHQSIIVHQLSISQLFVSPLISHISLLSLPFLISLLSSSSYILSSSFSSFHLLYTARSTERSSSIFLRTRSNPGPSDIIDSLGLSPGGWTPPSSSPTPGRRESASDLLGVNSLQSSRPPTSLNIYYLIKEDEKKEQRKRERQDKTKKKKE